MLWALFTINSILFPILLFNIVRLLFRSQRASAKKWLKISGVAFVVGVSLSGVLAQREADRKAVAAGFESSSEEQKALVEGIRDPAAWRVRRAELEIAAAKRRKEEERQAAAARDAAARKKAEEEKLAARKEQNCHKDLNCIVDKKRVLANSYCEAPVESLAKYQHEWTNGWTLKFPYYRWKDQTAGIVTFYGDAAKFQNGFGAWQNIVYECDFDTRSDRPIDVRAEAGRLR